MKRNPTLLLFIAIHLVSCLGVIDSNTLRQVTTPLKKEEIRGIWKADKFSYFFSDSTKRPLPLSLTINSDSTFTAVNFPSYSTSARGFLGPEQIPKFKGTWAIRLYKKQVELMITFKSEKRDIPDMYLRFYKHKPEDKLALVCFTGDPDDGNRFLFLKENK